jgi:regulator of protease activity HflC (stomatin/prohibitin superfamily)
MAETVRIQGSGGPPPRRGGPQLAGRWSRWVRPALTATVVAAVAYGIYFWEFRRIVVHPNEVLVLLRKSGARTLGGDNIIIPRPPDKSDPDYANRQREWESAYGDCNGILEQVYPEGTYFGFSPFDYERTVINIEQSAIVPAGKVGIVVKKFGKPLDVDAAGNNVQILADPARDQRGPLAIVLRPGRYNEYANPYAYEIKQVDPVQIDPGYRGVVTNVTGPVSPEANGYLVAAGERGVQRQTEPEGFRYINPFQARIRPVSTVSQRFEMSGKDLIHFPSADSFDIQLEGFVEWSINPEKLPLVYVEYANGGDLIPFLQEDVILPYARSFCRLAGSQYDARDFISGDTKLKFQAEFERQLREVCARQGIEVKQALVRNIVPPDAIKQPINDREVAVEQILQYDQQIKVAQSQATLATQQELAEQNKAIGDANTAVVKVVKAAEQDRDVAVTEAEQRLAVAQLQLQAAQRQADALTARGRAAADVTLLEKQAQAEPLRRTVAAFGGGDAYAQFTFNQKVAPAVKSILATTDGPFGELFRQFTAPPTTAPTTRPVPAAVADKTAAATAR